MNQLILLRGYPGSGKTTIGKLLEKRGVGKFIDHNAILTFISTISGDDDGIYDDIANLEQAIARKLLTANKIDFSEDVIITIQDLSTKLSIKLPRQYSPRFRYNAGHRIHSAIHRKSRYLRR